MTEEQIMAGHQALRQMEDALLLLDQAAVALDAAAHLDLAIERLAAELGCRRSEDGSIHRN